MPTFRGEQGPDMLASLRTTTIAWLALSLSTTAGGCRSDGRHCVGTPSPGDCGDAACCNASDHGPSSAWQAGGECVLCEQGGVCACRTSRLRMLGGRLFGGRWAGSTGFDAMGGRPAGFGFAGMAFPPPPDDTPPAPARFHPVPVRPVFEPAIDETPPAIVPPEPVAVPIPSP